MVRFYHRMRFDSTDMEGNPSIEWRHVSGVRTHRSVKWCLNSFKRRFLSCGNRTFVGTRVNHTVNGHLREIFSFLRSRRQGSCWKVI